MVSGAPNATEIMEGTKYGLIDPMHLPLYNTLLLLSSSVRLTISNHALRANNRFQTILWLAITVALGIIFLFVQFYEYYEAYAHFGLTLNSGIYGSTFFLLTGFHGFHVSLGTFMLMVMLYRAFKNHFSPEDCFGFESASWYWHFVDVVWLCLFFFIYIF